MEKFTKGPWFSKEGDRFSKEVLITSSERDDNSIVPICEMDVYFDGIIGDEQPANASLIAAAPEMYEFIKSIQLGSVADEIKREELLAKARGE